VTTSPQTNSAHKVYQKGRNVLKKGVPPQMHHCHRALFVAMASLRQQPSPRLPLSAGGLAVKKGAAGLFVSTCAATGLGVI
jgi:hypothetical protein